MTLPLVATLALLSQTDPTTDAAARAAAAAEKAALAAEKAAAAAQRIAEAQGAPAAPAADKPADGAEPEEKWAGLIGVSLIALSGNAESITALANAAADRKWAKWMFGVRAGAAYGETRIATGSEVSALRGNLSLRGDRNVVTFATIFAQAGVDTDHVKSVELRGYGEVGTGIRFYEKKEGDLEKIYIRADLAFRFQQEERFQYYATPTTPAGTALPDATLVAPRIAAVFRYAMSKDIRFTEEVEFLPNVLGQSRVLVNNTTKLNARLTESLSVSAAFIANFDSSPAAGKKDLDTSLALGVEAAF